MTILRIIVFLLIGLVPPWGFVFFVARQDLITPTTSWEWMYWILGAPATWIAFCAAVAQISGYSLRDVWAGRKARPERFTSSGFPFVAVSPRDLPSRLPNLLWPDIPYVSRLPRPEQDTLVLDMRSSRILIIGRTGLGKTREAIELIRRIEDEKGEPVVVLLPTGLLDVPDTIPTDLPTRNLVLFVDNLNAHFVRPRIQEFDDPKLIEADFRQRLEQTIQAFAEHCRGYDFRMVATAIGEPDLRDRLQLNAPLWDEFRIINLPDLSPGQRPAYMEALEQYFEISITPNAKTLIAQRSDGTYSGMIVPLLKEKRVSAQITVDNADDYSYVYPEDWQTRVYKPIIEPVPERRSLLEALSLVQQANLVPYEFLVVEVAARLYASSFLIIRRTQVRKALQDLTDWIRLSHGVLSCPEAYYLDKGNLREGLNTLVAALLHLIHDTAYFAQLRIPLHGLIRTLSLKLGDIDTAVKLNLAVLEADATDPRDWSQLAFLHLLREEYQEAVETALKSLALAPHPIAWLILGRAYDGQRLYDEAIDACRNALLLSPGLAAGWSQLGVALNKTHRYEEAIEAGEKATRLDPANSPAWISLAITYDRSGMAREAIAAGKRALALDDRDPVAWQTIGVTYSRAGLYDEAIHACQRAGWLEPGSAIAWRLLSRVLEEAGRIEEAIEPAQKATTIDPTNPRNWLSLGILLHHARQSTQSLEALRTATELDPDMVPAWMALGQTASELGRTDILTSVSEKLAALETNDHRVWRYRGIAHAKANQPREALAALQRASELSPGDADTWRFLSTSYLKLGQLHKALEALNRANDLSPSRADSVRYVRLSQAMSKQPSLAVGALLRAVEIVPDEADVWRYLGISYANAGQSAEAVAALQKAVELAPEDQEAWRYLGITYGRAGKLYEALATLKKATRLAPEDPQAWRHLGITYDKSGQAEASLAALQRAVELAPEDGRAWRYLGIAYGRAGQLQEAVAALERATELAPRDAEAWRYLGIGRGNANQTKEALAALEKAVELTPKDGITWRYLGISYGNAGQPQEALAALKRATELVPTNAQAWRYLGISCGRAGQLQEAVVALERATELAPKDAEVWRYLGISRGNANQTQEALAALEKAVALDVSDIESHFYLGIAFTRAGNIDRAAEAFQRVLELAPWSDRAEEARTRLSRLSGTLAVPTGSDKNDEIRHHIQNAQVAYAAKRYEECIQYCLTVIQAEPDHPLAHRLLSSSYRRTGQDQEALPPALRLVELLPEDAEAWYILGLRQSKLEQDESAITSFRRALALSPDFSGVIRELGKVLCRNGQLEEALILLRWGRETQPRNKSIWSLYGQALAQNKQYEEATVIFDRVADMVNKTARAYAELGDLYLTSRALDKAKMAFEESLKLNSDYIPALFGLAHHYRFVGDVQTALSYFRRVIALDPENTSALRNVEQLIGSDGQNETA